jgi:hypothetical protein
MCITRMYFDVWCILYTHSHRGENLCPLKAHDPFQGGLVLQMLKTQMDCYSKTQRNIQELGPSGARVKQKVALCNLS